MLVVEDEPVIRMNACVVLEDAGFVVLEAEDAASALAIIERHPEVRVLFTDIHMPGGMDGFALAQEVHRRWPNVRLLLTSGRAAPAESEVPDHGVFLPKPYSHDQVMRTVRHMAA